MSSDLPGGRCASADGADSPVWLLCGLVVPAVFLLQIGSGAYHNDLASDPDEAAHFTTGVMVYDYCRTSPGANPVAFAESYYVRYPKVAFGNWPPAFYCLQAGWYFVFGPSKASAIALVGVVGAVTGVRLLRRLAADLGRVPALLAVALFLSLPAVRFYSSAVMADSLVCLFELLAVFAFADFLEGRRGRHAAAFLFWASLALLTKGTAVALALFVPLAAAFTGKFGVFRSPRLWAAGLLVVLLSAPFYLAAMTAGLGLHGHSGLYHLAVNSLLPHGRVPDVRGALLVVPPALILLAVPAAIRYLLRRVRGLPAGRDTGVALAWAVAIFVCQVLSPFRAERYFLPATLPLTILAAETLGWLLNSSTGPVRIPRVAFAAALVTVAIATTVPIPVRPHLAGYAAAADSLPRRDGGTVTLVSSDELGEGAFIAEAVQADRPRRDVVLRGSKVLSNSTWNGDGYRLRLTTPAEVRAYLDDVPVNYVVLDNYGYRGARSRPHHELLREVVRGAPDAFRPAGEFPVFRDGKRCDESIEVYENVAARGRFFRTIRIDLSTSQLGRVLELRNPFLPEEHASSR